MNVLPEEPVAVNNSINGDGMQCNTPPHCSPTETWKIQVR